MKKRRLTSFSQYQKTLLKKGMAIAAVCTHSSYGRVIFSQVIRNPSCDLLTSMKTSTKKALSDKFQKQNQEFHNGREPDLSVDDYTGLLAKEYLEERKYWKLSKNKYPCLEWLDEDNPWSGVVSKAKEDISSYFELRVFPDWLQLVWDNELDIDVDEKTAQCINSGIKYIFEDLDIDPDYYHDFYWDETVPLDRLLHSCRLTKTKFKIVKTSYLNTLLSPIFDNYNQSLVYLASPDTTYFVIGRPYFYPIIAGERSDGSHEITIFEACNEF